MASITKNHIILQTILIHAFMSFQPLTNDNYNKVHIYTFHSIVLKWQ